MLTEATLDLAAPELPLAWAEQENADGVVGSGAVGVRKPPARQLLKWIGNKQRSAASIASYLPQTYGCYFEPFLGAGAVLGTMAPSQGVAGDALGPLIDLWRLVKEEPERVTRHYRNLWLRYAEDRQMVYTSVLRRYNARPNGLDLLFLCRTCYGGVVRFTKSGTMSTPLGPHLAIPPPRFAERVAEWRKRVADTHFVHASFEDTMSEAGQGDVIYCDPPYAFSQQILYGAQSFELGKLWAAIEQATRRGAYVALSIDGHKRSGQTQLNLDLPDGLFKRQLLLSTGGSMLKRFQLRDGSVRGEHVTDRLLLNW